MTCSLADCDRPVHARGYCGPHYSRVLRYGDPHAGGPMRARYRKLGWPVNLLSRLELTDDGCLIFTGRLDKLGYARVTGPDGRLGMVHRLMYELAAGPIPEGLELDHLCRVRHCVNPAHMEPVTHRENTLRGFGFSSANLAKTHCPAGHEFTPENTYTYPKGNRKCRTCAAAQRRAYEDRQKGAA